MASTAQLPKEKNRLVVKMRLRSCKTFFPKIEQFVIIKYKLNLKLFEKSFEDRSDQLLKSSTIHILCHSFLCVYILEQTFP